MPLVLDAGCNPVVPAVSRGSQYMQQAWFGKHFGNLLHKQEQAHACLVAACSSNGQDCLSQAHAGNLLHQYQDVACSDLATPQQGHPYNTPAQHQHCYGGCASGS